MLWWGRALCGAAALNVCLWLAVWHFGPVAGVHGGLQLAPSGVNVAVCACRSVRPRVDLQRLVVVDTHLSSIFRGRAAGAAGAGDRRRQRLDQGARDAWQRRVPSGTWAAWKAVARWLTPYFSFGVWVSIARVCVPGA